MGQYWIPVNLDKREFVMPHKLATGLKLWEQLANHPGTGAALIVLCAAMPEPRGGGDLQIENGADKVIGRWAGDRVALIGDYAEDGDCGIADAELIYSCCAENKAEFDERLVWYREHEPEKADRVAKLGRFRDVSALVCKVIARELRGKYSGTGWRDFTGAK